MVAYRYIVIVQKHEAIELQSTDELAVATLIDALSHSTCGVCLARRESPFGYFYHCRFSGSNGNIEWACELIAERLGKDGWVRLDSSAATTPKADRLMYFGIPPAKQTPATLPKN